jgi:acetyl/propionyl-CoA carboxylase alpha subunit
MLSSYDSYVRDYQNRMDNHAYQTWRNELANKRLLLSDTYRQEDKATEEARYKDTKQYRDEQLKRQSSQDEFTRERFDFQKEQAEKAEAMEKDKFEWQKQLPYIQSSLAQAKKKGELDEWIQKETLKLQFDKEKNKYYLYDSGGKPRAAVNSEGEIQKLYDVITSDPAVKDQADGLMASLKSELGEGVTMNHMKIIVSKLWDRSEAAKQYLGVQEQKQPQSFDLGSYARPEYKGPVRNSDTVTPSPATTGQKQEQPAIDYSTLTY